MGRKERGPRTEPQETLTFMEEWMKGGCQHRWRRVAEKSEGDRERVYHRNLRMRGLRSRKWSVAKPQRWPKQVQGEKCPMIWPQGGLGDKNSIREMRYPLRKCRTREGGSLCVLGWERLKEDTEGGC